ncbi:39S ribosomal protein L30, mitochondrial-like [Penaeus japonicus]|uniref:39S ribosomal protein L30, mitochondrial-like n=1 Tax=Penaeus japonicus TaxID=27405 RepID=UPI001C70B8BD|nr:39S ribosomal protein L30, mitochondrial-like [Penaeus japonicus]
MLRHALLRLQTPSAAAVSVRGKKSSAAAKDHSISWSTGEVQHPAPPDCPVGNRGEYPQQLPDGSLQYFGFQYYPRHPGQVDPPYDPAPLHLVTRVRCLKKKPWWDKMIMKQLGLDKKRSDVAVVKNNPENNAMLWKVKHLVKITPIRVPENLPEDMDPACCFLKETGEFIYSPHIKVDEKALQVDEKLVATKWNQDFVDRETRKNWEHPWQIKLC